MSRKEDTAPNRGPTTRRADMSTSVISTGAARRDTLGRRIGFNWWREYVMNHYTGAELHWLRLRDSGEAINTGTVVAGQKRYAEAVELLAPAEPIARQAFTGAYGAWLARLLLNLGRARGGLGEFAAAERGLLEAQPLFEQTLGPKHRDTRGCAQAVVELYVAWDQAEPGKGHDAKAASWRSKLDAGK